MNTIHSPAIHLIAEHKHMSSPCLPALLFGKLNDKQSKLDADIGDMKRDMRSIQEQNTEMKDDVRSMQARMKDMISSLESLTLQQKVRAQ